MAGETINPAAVGNPHPSNSQPGPGNPRGHHHQSGGLGHGHNPPVPGTKLRDGSEYIASFSLILAEISKKDGDFSYFVNIPERTASLAPVDGTGKAYSIALDQITSAAASSGSKATPAAASGGASHPPAQIHVHVWVSDAVVADGTGKSGYKVGVLITAGSGAVHVGPFWGSLHRTGKEFVNVTVNSPVFSGNAKVSLSSTATDNNKLDLSASFIGKLYSGETASLKAINYKRGS